MEKNELRKLREDLLEQVKAMPAEQAGALQRQIMEMNDAEFEEFLKKNKMLRGAGQECIFCLIARGEIESFVVAENDEIVVVLELAPISKGHTIVIPKKHISEVELVSENVINVAKLVSALLKKKLNAKKIDMIINSKIGHVILNLIPVYDKEFELPREKADKKELRKLSKELYFEFEEKKEEKKEKNRGSEEFYELPRRIP